MLVVGARPKAFEVVSGISFTKPIDHEALLSLSVIILRRESSIVVDIGWFQIINLRDVVIIDQFILECGKTVEDHYDEETNLKAQTVLWKEEGFQ